MFIFIETESATGTIGQGAGKCCCLRDTVAVWDAEKVLEVKDGDACTTIQMPESHLVGDG